MHLIRNVCTLQVRALACNSLLHMLLYQFENKKCECSSYQKKTLKLSNIIIVFILDVFTTYGSCLTFIRLTVVLCALHEPNYNLKAIIVAIVI